MRRRSPVRSVLAERKMFAGGGMLPISTPMKKEPSGILASSEPLIDAVSQEILAPMMGGAMPMAQGGVLSLNIGGLGKAPKGLNSPFAQKTKDRIDRINKVNALIKDGVPVRRAMQLVDGAYFAPGEIREDGEEGGGPITTVSEDVIKAVPSPTDMSFSIASTPEAINFSKGTSQGISDLARIAILSGQGVDPEDAYKRVTEERMDKKDVRIQPQQEEESGAQPPIGDFEGPIFSFSRADESQKTAEPDNVLQRTAEQDMEILEADRGSFPTEVLPEAMSKKIKTEASGTVGKAGRVGDVIEGTEPPITVEEDKSPAESVAETFGKKDMSEKEATKTIADFKKEFMDEMPEYEGMSEAEKGFALMEAGLRVAAGESPNAITNVAKGLKGLGAQFAKDDKEKRAFNRQVALSASKYALQKVNVDRDRLKAFQEKEKDIVQVMNPETGDVKTITKADLRTGNIPKGYLATKDPYGDYIKGVKATKDLIVAKANAAGKTDITSKWLSVGKEYDQNAQKVLDSIQSKNLLGPAIKILYDPNIPVTGVQGIMTQSWNRFSNALGLSANDVMAKKGEAKEKYISRVQQVIAKKITAILGESNRMISTPDRERADDIAGVFADYLYDPLVKDPDILKDKLRNLYQTLDNDEKLGRAFMTRVEDSVGNLTVPGGEKLYADVLRKSANSILGTGKGIGPKGKIRKLSDFGSFDSKGVFR